MRERPACPAAIIGNSRLLAAFSPTGELTALFWPHIDYGQHVYAMNLGLQTGDGPVVWLQDASWRQTQSYEPDSAVLWTRSEHAPTGLAVDQADFAPPGQEALVRRISVQNESAEPQAVRLLVYAHLRLNESPQYNTVLYDESQHMLCFYRRDQWVALAADTAPSTWQAGRTIDCGDVNGALAFDLGTLAPGARRGVALAIALGRTRAEVEAQVQRLRGQQVTTWQQQTSLWWKRWLAAGRKVSTGDVRLDELYRRSLIALKLMSDERGGGFIAGPECDPEYQRSGGYGYCWGRDAAYMTTALDEAGHHGESAAFFLKWYCRA